MTELYLKLFAGLAIGFVLGLYTQRTVRWARSYIPEKIAARRKFKRLDKACQKWNAEAEVLMEAEIAAEPDEGKQKRIPFMWSQIVWQEIDMWNRLDKIVTTDEFESICNRRGFSQPQRDYLEEIMVHIDLLRPMSVEEKAAREAELDAEVQSAEKDLRNDYPGAVPMDSSLFEEINDKEQT